MDVILAVYTMDSERYTDCDAARVPLTPDLARLALRRIATLRAIQAKDPSADRIAYWDNHVQFFGWYEELGVDLDDVAVSEEEVHVSEEFLGDADCVRMVVEQSGIHWTACDPAGLFVQTAEIPLDLLEETASVSVEEMRHG